MVFGPKGIAYTHAVNIVFRLGTRIRIRLVVRSVQLIGCRGTWLCNARRRVRLCAGDVGIGSVATLVFCGFMCVLQVYGGDGSRQNLVTLR